MAVNSVKTTESPMLPEGLFEVGIRGRLLTLATELFAARGYHGVSVRDLTEPLGVKSSSLYAQFASKEELYAELVFEANEQITARLRSVRDGTSATRFLRDLVTRYVEFHATYPALARLAHNDLHVLSAQSLARVARNRREGSETFLRAITRGNETKEFACAKPWLAVTAIASLGIRVATWYQQPAAEDAVGGYPAEVHEWMHQDISVRTLCNTYADYALAMVGKR
ncbi:MAG: TetR/AcrR family transcriptional regulator [Mycobacteriales bacterium]